MDQHEDMTGDGLETSPSESILSMDRLSHLSSDLLARLIVSMVDSLGPQARKCLETALDRELNNSNKDCEAIFKIAESSSKEVNEASDTKPGHESNSLIEGPKKKKPRIAREFDMSKYVLYS